MVDETVDLLVYIVPWHGSTHPSCQPAEAGGFQIWGQSGQFSEILSQKQKTKEKAKGIVQCEGAECNPQYRK